MWTCPKCGRTFKRQEQSHFCGKAPETIEEYIAAQPEEVQQYLREIRGTLRAVLPDAEERISWSMPTYWMGHNIIHLIQDQQGNYTVSIQQAGSGGINFRYCQMVL